MGDRGDRQIERCAGRQVEVQIYHFVLCYHIYKMRESDDFPGVAYTGQTKSGSEGREEMIER